MMALTEKTVMAGIMTFTLYCALPLGVLWFIVKRKRVTAAYAEKPEDRSDPTRQQHDSNKT
jgi:hypothetical protein